jgi:hypothetical protein
MQSALSPWREMRENAAKELLFSPLLLIGREVGMRSAGRDGQPRDIRHRLSLLARGIR